LRLRTTTSLTVPLSSPTLRGDRTRDRADAARRRVAATIRSRSSERIYAAASALRDRDDVLAVTADVTNPAAVDSLVSEHEQTR
jgi:NAD(P)-dependent dehydrogenase (short-subunit alcohol dehydrogenase family)